jgi:hypothetical protein
MFSQSSDSLGFRSFGITSSNGFNNNIGYLGLSLHYAVNSHIVVEAGLGRGRWGKKTSCNVQYYPSKNYYHWFLKGAYSYSSGMTNVLINVTDTLGNDNVYNMDLYPAQNIQITIGKYWPLHNKNRFYVEGGYSILLANKEDLYYNIGSSSVWTDYSKMRIESWIPGGFVLAIGYTLGF